MPGQPIVLPLDVSTIDGEVWIEIDAVDVTEFATVSEGRLVLDPSLPFEGSEHEIVVYLRDGDGPVVLARYGFATSAGQAGWTSSINALHEAGASYLATSAETEQIDGNPLDIGDNFVRLQRRGDTIDLAGRIGTQTLSRDRALFSDVTRRGRRDFGGARRPWRGWPEPARCSGGWVRWGRTGARSPSRPRGVWAAAAPPGRCGRHDRRGRS